MIGFECETFLGLGEWHDVASQASTNMDPWHLDAEEAQRCEHAACNTSVGKMAKDASH